MCFFFCKQKTAYEMRISDWSSDVCSSDLISFNYFISQTVGDYPANAVDLLAAQGARLLPDYRFNPHTGLWSHRDGAVEPPLRLTDVEFRADGTVHYPRSEERRVGKECVRTCNSRLSPEHVKKKTKT